MGSIAKLKRLALDTLLAEEDYVLLVINPLAEGVKLPPALIEAGQPVPLNIGFRMAVNVPDLEISDLGVSGTLSFNRTPHPCMLPWGAVMQISVGDEHLVWVVPIGAQGDTSNEADADEAPEAKKNHLKLV